jgi:hypothetical protein
MCLKPFSKRLATNLVAVIILSGALLRARHAVEVLTPTGGLPPQLVGQMREPAAFVETADGRYLVYDRRAQTVFSVDAKKTALKKLIPIGPSDGEILRPLAFIPGPERTFLIHDSPGQYDRVQKFYDDGTALEAFRRWPQKGEPMQLNVDAMLVSGFGAMAVIGPDVLAQVPDGAALMSQVTFTGQITRRIGVLRPTGYESDVALHRTLNAGRPLVAPDGSLYFVFTMGVPMYRKYSAAGELIFERHIEGPELDATLQSLPTEWPRRVMSGAEFAHVTPTVQTATVDPQGRLWITLIEPFTYVYDADGNKVKTVQFRGAGVISPTSLFFAKGGRVLVTPGCYEYTPN